MTCDESLRKLSQYLDRELDDAAVRELARHLAECRQCFSLTEFERRLRAMVRRACRCDQVPPALLERLDEILRRY